MAWCCSGYKPLSEPMMVILLTHICVTRPQWVKLTWCFYSVTYHALNLIYSIWWPLTKVRGVLELYHNFHPHRSKANVISLINVTEWNFYFCFISHDSIAQEDQKEYIYFFIFLRSKINVTPNLIQWCIAHYWLVPGRLDYIFLFASMPFLLIHLPLDKMAAVVQTIFSDAFLWMKTFVFWLKFHWSLFLRVQ